MPTATGTTGGVDIQAFTGGQERGIEVSLCFI